MKLPVNTIDFWKERIDRAKSEGKPNFHFSVYLARPSLWAEIGRVHEEIIRRECTGYKTLDAGCGYGRASEWVDNYVGVDFSPDFIKEANIRYPGKTFKQADLSNLSFTDSFFDVAFCISIKQMIVGNLGDPIWQDIENELKRVARKVLILEYEEPEKYFIL